MSKKVALLLGSGISYSSGAPSVKTITNRVMNALIESDECSRRAQDLMRILLDHIDPHLMDRENREPNYEDLYSCLIQITQDLDSEVTNPMIAGSLRRLKDATAFLTVSQNSISFKDPFRELIKVAANLIQKTVFDLLMPVNTPQGFDLIASLARYTRDLDIYSLNHDILIEKHLKDNCICYNDGYPKSKDEGDAYQYQGGWNSTDACVKLFKLHGSIDWYLVEVEKADGKVREYIRVENPLGQRKDASGKPFYNTQPSAAFLSGSIIKEQFYGLALIGELFQEFRERTKKCEVIISSGYGWGDRGINQRVEQWLRDSKNHKLIILQNEKKSQKVEEYHFWKSWRGQSLFGDRVIVLQQWLSETRIEDIKHFID